MKRSGLLVGILVGLMCGTVTDWARGAQPRQRPQRQRRRGQPRVPRLPQGVELIRDVVYGKGGERDLKMDILRPKQTPAQPMPALVWIHGGGWRGGNKVSGLMRLYHYPRRGYVCATIEYRLTGEAIFPAQIEDCKCAIRFLRAKANEYHIDPNRIGVWGLSAGGHLVALLGTSGDVKELEGTGGWAQYSSRVQAVCDWCGPSDFSAMVGLKRPMDRDPSRSPEVLLIGGPIDQNKQKAALASPVTHVSKDDPPFLILHGDQDRTVPVDQSRRLHAALTKAGVASTLYEVKGAGHGFGRRPEALEMVDGFFGEHLRPVQAATSRAAGQ